MQKRLDKLDRLDLRLAFLQSKLDEAIKANHPQWIVNALKDDLDRLEEFKRAHYFRVLMNGRGVY